jgi:predicted permease
MRKFIAAAVRKFISDYLIATVVVALVGWFLWAVFRPRDPDEDKTWTLVILSNGVALMPGYENMAACKAASQQLREQAEASPPVTACIVAGSNR